MASEGSVLIVFVHGAGTSRESFSHIIASLTSRGVPPTCLLPLELLGHGSRADPSTSVDLSLPSLTTDLYLELRHALASPGGHAGLVLVGHSLGACVCAAVTASSSLVLPVPVRALVVIDMVEGTAVAAIPGMEGALRGWPRRFRELGEAVDWAVESGTVARREVAEVVVPSRLIRLEDGADWQWRVDVLQLRPLWEGWFAGMTANFLATRAPKLLVLRRAERIDGALLAAQMQGRFALAVIDGNGHAGHEIHSDAPEEVADALVSFLSRFKAITVNTEPPDTDPIMMSPELTKLV
jgi:protein phosphatase methylesterase 1